MLFYLATFFALWLLHRWVSMRKLPPGPPSIPLLGCLPFVFPQTLSSKLFTSDEMYKKYGSIVRFETGVRKFYVLNDFDQVNMG